MTPREFFDLANKHAMVYNPFGVTVQAVKETGWFKSELCREAFNFGGIKARKGDPVYVKTSPEEINGKMVQVVSNFRKFESVDDYLERLNDKLMADRYKVCREGRSCFWVHFAGLYLGGWATDSHYFQGLCDLVPKLAPELLGEYWQTRIKSAYQIAKTSGKIQLWMARKIEETLNGCQ